MRDSQIDITIPKINESGNTEWDCPICGHRCGDEGDITAEVIFDGACVWCRQEILGVSRRVRGDELRELWENRRVGGDQ